MVKRLKNFEEKKKNQKYSQKLNNKEEEAIK